MSDNDEGVKSRVCFSRFDFIFFFCSMPALTGFFFSPFDVFVVFLFFCAVIKKRFVYGKGVVVFLLFSLSLLFSSLLSLDVFVYEKVLSLFFLFMVLFSVFYLLRCGFFTARGAIHYWALGLIPGAAVVFFQQLYPSVEIFNFDELKSSPVPGFDFIRGTGMLYNPNSFAAYAVLCCLYFFHKKNYFLFVVASVAALFTFSKTVFLVPIFVLFYSFFKFRLKSWLFALILVFLSFYFFYDLVYGLMVNRLENADSLGSRSDIVSYYIGLDYSVMDLIFGHGAHSDTNEIGRIHNKFLSVFFQFGFLGVFFLSFFYFYPTWRFAFVGRYSGEKVFLVLSMMLVILFSMVSTFTLFSFDYVIVLVCFFYHQEVVSRCQKIGGAACAG